MDTSPNKNAMLIFSSLQWKQETIINIYLNMSFIPKKRIEIQIVSLSNSFNENASSTSL